MTASASMDALIPQPASTVTALREAITRIAPAALPAFNRQLDEAADKVAQASDAEPLRHFTGMWAVYVYIQRQPRLAARFRELEEMSQSTMDDFRVRRAATELHTILDEAHAALEHSASR